MAALPGKQILGLLFVAALMVRIIAMAVSPYPYHGLIGGEMISDAVEYDVLARNVASGGGFGFYPGVPTAFRNPLLPFLGAAVYVVIGPHPIGVQVVLILLGSLIPPVVFSLARKYVEPATALLAASIAVFYPSLVVFSNSFMTETPFVLLLLLTLLCWSRFSQKTRGGWGTIILGGICLGLAMLTRSTVLPMIVLWALYLLIDGGRERWKHLLRLAVFSAVALAVILPWSLRNHRVFGRWVPITTNGGYTLWQRYNPLPPDGTVNSRQDIQQELIRIYGITRARIDAGEDPVTVMRPYMAQTVRGYLLRLGSKEMRYVHSFDGLNEAQVDKRLFREAFATMTKFPGKAAIKILKNAVKYWEPFHDPDLKRRHRQYSLSYGVLAVFMVWGLWQSRHQRRRFMLLHIAIVAFWVISAVGLHVIRYRLPIETVGMIFAASSVIALFRRHQSQWIPWVVIGAVVLANVLIMVFAAPWLQQVRQTIHGIG